MNKFQEYSKFPDLESALEYTQILEENNIPFQLDDSAMRFKVDPSYDTWDKNYILRLQESDIERAEKLFNQKIKLEVSEIVDDHYLYSFADKDILEIIANQSEWTKAEVALALKIANERKIELSAEAIKGAKKKKEAQTEFRLTIELTAGTFWVIALFSIANSIFLRKGINLHLPGLMITEVLENIALNLYGVGNQIGIILCIMISGIFFLLARFGRRYKWVFLFGLILYLIDSLFLLMYPRWLNMIFMLLVLPNMITGLRNTIKDQAAENKTSTSA
jgi:hypothetical protein